MILCVFPQPSIPSAQRKMARTTGRMTGVRGAQSDCGRVAPMGPPESLGSPISLARGRVVWNANARSPAGILGGASSSGSETRCATGGLADRSRRHNRRQEVGEGGVRNTPGRRVVIVGAVVLEAARVEDV